MAYLRLDFFRGISALSEACSVVAPTLEPFAFDRVTHDLLERCARKSYGANERHPWNNIALCYMRMLYTCTWAQIRQCGVHPARRPLIFLTKTCYFLRLKFYDLFLLNKTLK